MKKYRRSDWHESQHDEAAEEPPSFWERIFHGFMILLSLSIIFLICGGFFLLVCGRYGSGIIFDDTSGNLVIPLFCLGGVSGVGIFLYLYHRKPRNVI